MLRSFKITLLASCVALASSSATAITAVESVENHQPSVFYKNKAEGWYWYVDPPEEAEEELLPPPPPEVPKEEPKAKEESKPVPPEPFSLKWVQEMLPRYKERAWNEPTQENVQAYFLVQRFAMDRANKFADVAQQVVVGNALLDESMRRPISTFANPKVDKKAGQEADLLLKKIAEKAGIFFFFKQGCSYCEAQAPLLGMLEKEYGFDILAVSIDGGQLESYQFKNTKVDAGQASVLGVTATPAMFLMNEDGKFTALGQSVIALSELRRRILLVAAREGWISEDEWKQTQPLLNPEAQHDLSQELPKLLKASTENPTMLFGSEKQTEKIVAMTDEDKKVLADETNFIEPQKLIALFGKAAKTSGTLTLNGEDDVENDTEE